MANSVMASVRVLPILFALLSLPRSVSAHRLDEYLQATIVAIEPNEVRLQIQLTPGVEIAEQVIALIDQDRDGLLSSNETAVYGELLKHDLVVRLDHGNLELKLIASNFPELTELRSGWGIIEMEFSLMPARLAAGSHRLTMENRHLPALSVYLFNAAQPRSDAIKVTRQKRNENQSLGEIEFTFHHPSNSLKAVGVVAWSIALLSAMFLSARRMGRIKPVRPAPRGL